MHWYNILSGVLTLALVLFIWIMASEPSSGEDNTFGPIDGAITFGIMGGLVVLAATGLLCIWAPNGVLWWAVGATLGCGLAAGVGFVRAERLRQFLEDNPPVWEADSYANPPGGYPPSDGPPGERLAQAPYQHGWSSSNEAPRLSDTDRILQKLQALIEKYDAKRTAANEQCERVHEKIAVFKEKGRTDLAEQLLADTSTLVEFARVTERLIAALQKRWFGVSIHSKFVQSVGSLPTFEDLPNLSELKTRREVNGARNRYREAVTRLREFHSRLAVQNTDFGSWVSHQSARFNDAPWIADVSEPFAARFQDLMTRVGEQIDDADAASLRLDTLLVIRADDDEVDVPFKLDSAAEEQFRRLLSELDVAVPLEDLAHIDINLEHIDADLNALENLALKTESDDEAARELEELVERWN